MRNNMEFEPNTTLPPPTDELIRWFEDEYRVKLPDDYLAALKAGNGAIPVRKVFRNGRVLERMLCLIPYPENDDVYGWYDLTAVISQLDTRLTNDENLIGMNIIPFGALFAGDFVCLDFRHNTRSPHIAAWDHERSEPFKP